MGLLTRSNSHKRQILLSVGVLLGFAVLSILSTKTKAQNEIQGSSAIDRTIRAVSTAAIGNQANVSIELDSQGDEVAAGFTLNFDPAKLTSPVVTLGSGVPQGTILTRNLNQEATGKVGILVDSDQAFAAAMPARQIVVVSFTVVPDASGITPITFGGSPTPGSVSSSTGNLLQTFYESGTVTIGNVYYYRVGGRVTNSDGRGLNNAAVTVTDPAGVRRTITTNSFGFYNFDEIESGKIYTFTVTSKRYRFPTHVFLPTANLTDLDFVGVE